MLPSRLREMRRLINKKCEQVFLNGKFLPPSKIFADMLDVYNASKDEEVKELEFFKSH